MQARFGQVVTFAMFLYARQVIALKNGIRRRLKDYIQYQFDNFIDFVEFPGAKKCQGAKMYSCSGRRDSELSPNAPIFLNHKSADDSKMGRIRIRYLTNAPKLFVLIHIDWGHFDRNAMAISFPKDNGVESKSNSESQCNKSV